MNNYKIQQLKNEISDKQRELAELLNEEESKQFYFVEGLSYSWEDVGEFVKYMGADFDFECFVKEIDGSVHINLEINACDLLRGKEVLKTL